MAALTTRDLLVRALRMHPRSSATELAKLLGVSRQFVVQLLKSLPPGDVLSAGKARRSRYALRRALRGDSTDLPVYAIDRDGRSHEFTTISLVYPEGTLARLSGTTWPLPAESRDGWWNGLPYPIAAMRPQGYLGRQLARAEHRELGVSENPNDWPDDDVLWVLSRRGSDVPGNVVVGSVAYERWLQSKLRAAQSLSIAAVPDAYVRFAQDALAAAGVGSSAAGEFPKFIAARDITGAATPHVIVKFSGSGDSGAERRWADLLVCESIALEIVDRLPGLRGARSRIVAAGGRTFLEVERFDRVGAHGRVAVCAMDAIAPFFLGTSSTRWPELMARLHELSLVSSADTAAVGRLWWFGRLIANADMHLGNLSFRVDGRFELAPVYDMLPMHYAPLPGGEVAERRFEPPLPLPHEQTAWNEAAHAAAMFWSQAANDGRISAAFRAECAHNAERVREVAARL